MASRRGIPVPKFEEPRLLTCARLANWSVNPIAKSTILGEEFLETALTCNHWSCGGNATSNPAPHRAPCSAWGLHRLLPPLPAWLELVDNSWRESALQYPSWPASVPSVTQDSQTLDYVRFSGYENTSMHMAVSRGSGAIGTADRGPEHAAEGGLALADRASVGGGMRHHGDHAAHRDIKADGVALAGALPGGRGRWPVARQEPAAGDAAAERRHQDAGADQDDARDAAGRDPLERALDGARGRHQPHQRPEYLARARPQAASGGQLQGLQRPGVRGESRGRGRPLPRSAGQGGGLFRSTRRAKSRHSTAANRACP